MSLPTQEVVTVLLKCPDDGLRYDIPENKRKLMDWLKNSPVKQIKNEKEDLAALAEYLKTRPEIEGVSDEQWFIRNSSPEARLLE